MDVAFVALVLMIAFCIYTVIPTVFNVILRIRFKRRVGRSVRIFITFDDGPDPIQTPQILKELKRYGVEATFFMVGEKIDRFPEIVAAVRASGHQIGEHSYYHFHPWYTNPFKTILDLTRCGKAVKKALEKNTCTLFRPPYGKFNIITCLYTLFRKKRNVFWNVDLTEYGKTGEVSRSEVALDGIKPGSVILLHEGKGRELAKDLGATETLRIILDDVRSKGIKVGNLRELFEN